MILTVYNAVLDFFEHFAVTDVFMIAVAASALCACVWCLLGRCLRL